VKAKFEAANPVLKSDQSNVDEMKAEEITAYLRPNPQFTMTADGTQIAPHEGSGSRLSGTQVPNFSYLHEREHKRELRLQSAQEGTQIAASQHEDLSATCCSACARRLCRRWRPRRCWTWRKATWTTTTRSSTSAGALQGGDLAQIDLDRIELLRVQYESEIQTAIVNLRTQKIRCCNCWTTARRWTSST
jgi:cobalt-zinc-cadmium efflux system outer membrane protein